MTTINDDEREAREWLSGAVNQGCLPGTALAEYGPEDDSKHRRTILALLDAPRMPHPDALTEEDVDRMCITFALDTGTAAEMLLRVYRVIWNRYTAPPKPKKVEAWAVVWPHYTAAFTDREDAEACAASGPQGAPCRIVKLVEDRDGE